MNATNRFLIACGSNVFCTFLQEQLTGCNVTWTQHFQILDLTVFRLAACVRAIEFHSGSDNLNPHDHLGMMFGAVDPQLAQPHTVRKPTCCLFAPARPVKPSGHQQLRHLQSRKPAHFLAHHGICKVSAISSISQTQTRSHNGTRPATEEMEIAIPELQHICRDALQTLGYDDQQSATITEVCFP